MAEMKDLVPIAGGRFLPARIAAVSVGVVILGVAAPLVYLAAQAGLALVGLGTVFVVGALLYKATPLVFQKWENRILSVRKQEAYDNPVEEAERYLINMAAEVKQKQHGLRERSAKIQSFAESIARERRSKPNLDYAMADMKLERAKAVLAADAEKYNNAVRILQEVRNEVEQLKEQMRIAKLSAEFDGDETPDDARKREEDSLLFQTAVASIHDRVGKAFADLSFGEDGTVSLGKTF